jgi:chromosome segregation ATPase
MSDEELIARLRDWPYQGETMAGEAAVRIEALTEQLAAAQHDAKEAEAYVEELEAKLVKAVEVLNALDATLDRNGWHVDSIAREDIRTTLADIKSHSKKTITEWPIEEGNIMVGEMK